MDASSSGYLICMQWELCCFLSNLHGNTLHFSGNPIKDRCRERLWQAGSACMDLLCTGAPAGNQHVHLLLQRSCSHRDSRPLFRAPTPHSCGNRPTPHADCESPDKPQWVPCVSLLQAQSFCFTWMQGSLVSGAPAHCRCQENQNFKHAMEASCSQTQLVSFWVSRVSWTVSHALGITLVCCIKHCVSSLQHFCKV